MKNFAIIIFLLASMNIFAQTTSIPDTNFERALIELGYDTGTPDGTVPTANISGVTSLSIPDYNISDLTGIEDFTSLTELSCSRNQLTSIDISANTLLISLLVYSNQLTSLDISANTSLNALWCYSNQLTSIDVSSHNSLTMLLCNDNQLTSLDVSANTALNKLNCSDNRLPELNVSNNIGLNELICKGNRFFDLDLSNNINLNYIDCSLNGKYIWVWDDIVGGIGHDEWLSLSSLNIKNGNNSVITTFHAQNNPNLTCIFVDNKNASYLSSWTKDETSTFVETEAECDALTSGESVKNNNFTISPNPAKEKFTINSENPVKTVKIYDIFGKLVKTYKNQENYSVLELNGGMYLIRIETNEAVKTLKLVVE